MRDIKIAELFAYVTIVKAIVVILTIADQFTNGLSIDLLRVPIYLFAFSIDVFVCGGIIKGRLDVSDIHCVRILTIFILADLAIWIISSRYYHLVIILAIIHLYVNNAVATILLC